MFRPIIHLQNASELYPNAWGRVDEFRASRGKDLPKWPAWCFLPMAGWYAIVSERHNVDRLGLDLIGDVPKLAAVGTWRYSQGIYRFDDDMRAALTQAVVKGEMPVEVLFRLPGWSLYIETPGMVFLGEPLHGYFAHLEWDANTERPELRLLLDTERGFVPIPVHIGAWTITEAIDRADDEAMRQAAMVGMRYEKSLDKTQAASMGVNPLISLLLYLCSESPEITDEQGQGLCPERPQPQRIGGKRQLVIPCQPRVWLVGMRTGERLRERQEANRHGRWYGFWTGQKTKYPKFVYQFIVGEER